MGRPRLSENIQSLIERGELETAVAELKKMLIATQNPVEACELSQQLAEVYGFKSDDPEWIAKALHYAALAGEGYVQEGRLPEALHLFYWLKSRPSHQHAAERLRGLIAATFSSRRSKKVSTDEEIPPPTPFQEIKGSVSFDSDPPELQRFQLNAIRSQTFAFFSSLKVQELELLMEYMNLMILEPGQDLYKQGSGSDCFFLVIDGELQKKQGALQVRVGPQEFVGDLGFFSGRNRGCDIKAVKRSSLVRFDQDTFEDYSKQFPNVRERFFQFFEKRLFLATFTQHPVFQGMGVESLFSLFDEGVLVTIPRGRALWKQGSQVDRFFLLVQGICQTETIEGSKTALPGALLGMSEFKSAAIVENITKTVSECCALEWRRDIFQDFLQSFPESKSRWAAIKPEDLASFSENLFD